MKASELIEELQKYDLNAEVLLDDGSAFGYTYEIGEVYFSGFSGEDYESVVYLEAKPNVFLTGV